MAGYNETLNKYLKVMSGAYESNGLKPENMGQVGDDSISIADGIGNALSTANTAVEGESHQSDESWWVRFANSLQNINRRVDEGFLNFFDTIGDAAMYVVGAIGGAFGNTGLEENMRNAINYDWQAQALKAINYIPSTNSLSTNIMKSMGGDNSGWDDMYSAMGSAEEERARLNNVENNTLIQNQTARRVVSGIEKGLGQAVPDLILAAATGGVSEGAALAIRAGEGAIKGTGVAAEKLSQEGTPLQKGAGYVALSATINTGLNLANEAIGGSVIGTPKEGFGAIGRLNGKIGANIQNDVARRIVVDGLNVAANVGLDVTTDMIQDAIDPVLRQTYDANAIYDAYGTPENRAKFAKQLGESALISAFTSLIQNGVRQVQYSMAAYRTDTKAIPEQQKALQQQEQETIDTGKRQRSLDAMNTEDVLEAEDRIAMEQQKSAQAIAMTQELLKHTTQSSKAEELSEQLEKTISESVKNMKRDYKTVIEALNSSEKIITRPEGSTSSPQSLKETAMSHFNAEEAISMTPPEDSSALLRHAVSPDSTRNKTVIEGQLSARNDSEGKLQLITKGSTGESTQYALTVLADEKNRLIDSEGNTLYTEGKGISASFDSRDLNMMDTDTRINIDAEKSDAGALMDLRNLLDDPMSSHTVSTDESTGTKTYIFESEGHETAVVVDSDGNATVKTVQEINRETDTRITERSKGEKEGLKGVSAQTVKNASPKAYADRNTIERMTDFIGRVFSTNQFRANGLDASFVKGAKIQEAERALFGSAGLDRDGTPEGDQAFSNAEDNFLKTLLREAKLSYDVKDPNTGKPTKLQVSLYDMFGDDDDARNEWMANTKSALTDVLLANDHLSTLEKTKLEGAERLANTKKRYDERIEKIQSENDAQYRYMKDRLTEQIRQLGDRTRTAVSCYRMMDRYKARVKKWNERPTAGQPDINPTPQTMDMKAYGKIAQGLSVNSSTRGLSGSSIEAIAGSGIKDVFSDDDRFQELYKEATKNVRVDTQPADPNDPNNTDTVDTYHYQRTRKNGSVYEAKTMSNEDMQATYELLKYIDKQYGYREQQSYAAYRQQKTAIVTELQALARSAKGKKYNRLNEFIDSTRGPESFMQEYLGRGSTAYDAVYTKPLQDHRRLQLFMSKTVAERDQMILDHNLKAGDFGKTMDFSYDDGTGNMKTMKITRGTAMNIYAASVSDNLPDLMDNGMELYDSASKRNTGVIKPTGEMLDRIADSLTADEKAFAEDVLTKGYNGSMRKALSDYGSSHGMEITEGSGERYMHINRGNLRIGANGPLEDFQKVSKMGMGIVKRRTSNSQPMVLGDIQTDYENYAYTVGLVTQMDHVRDMNRFLDLKMGKESANSTMRNNLPGGGKWLDDWQKRVNGLPTGTTKRGSKIFSNALASPILVNFGTWAKMPLDAMRTIPTVGLRAFTKGVFRGIMSSFTPNGRRAMNDLVQNTGLYAANTMERWAVSSNTVWNNFSKASNIFSKPIQAINNYTIKYMMAPVMQEWVADSYTSNGVTKAGYEIGGTNNDLEVQNRLDTMGMMFMSNSDSLDMSTLRTGTGPMGALGQFFFAPYGGDSQKWSEAMYESVTGRRASARRAQALEDGQTELDRMMQDSLNNTAALQQQRQTLMDEMNADGTAESRKKYLQDRIDATDRKLADEQGNQEAINRAKIDFSKDATEAKSAERQAPKKAAMVVGTLVASAAIETAIDMANQKLKGKDEKKEDILTDFATNATVGWMPYISTFANAVKYNRDIGSSYMTWSSAALDMFRQIGKTIENGGDSQDVWKTVCSMADMLGYVTGVPIQSIDAYLKGAIRNMKWDDAYSFYSTIHGYTGDYLSAQMGKDRADPNKVKMNLSAKMNLFGAGKPKENVLNELSRLYSEGKMSAPKDYPSEYKAGQADTFRDVYQAANDQAERMMASGRYSVLDDDRKGKALQKMYDAYYGASKALTEGSFENLSRSAKVIALTEGSMANMGNIFLVAAQAEKASDITKATDLSLNGKLLAKYLAGFSLSDDELARLRKYLRLYGADIPSIKL